jgi:5,6-dimethylbenzimidazole synthase
MAMSDQFSTQERMAFYRVIESRHDIHAFRPDPIPEEVLLRVLGAAHHAPSVGLMQPWNFILIQDPATKVRVHEVFLRENEVAASNYAGPRADLYRGLELDGILGAPVNLCVTCDRTRGGPHVLGRNTILETDLFSTCCAIENLWLAARVEDVGVGWVSVLDNEELRTILAIPAHVVPVAYLCLGYPQRLLDEPELQRRGWGHRMPLSDVLYRERWGA